MPITRASTSTLLLGLLLGLLFGSALAQDSAASPPRAKIDTLLHVPLDPAFTPDREVLVDLIEIPPDTALDRHWHPGEEFHVYLEGEVEIQIEGRDSIHGTPGTAGHVPFERPHRAVAGASGAKVLVFRVHTRGRPWRYPAPAGEPGPRREQRGSGLLGRQ